MWIRNWPVPRMVWEAMEKQSHTLFSDGTFSLILGGDCSIIVGSVDCLVKQLGSQVYVLSIDAHIDAIAPNPQQCTGTAGMGLWFLTNENSFWPVPAGFTKENITVLAAQFILNPGIHIPHVSLGVLRAEGIEGCLRRVLGAIPAEAALLILFDVDAIGQARSLRFTPQVLWV